MANVPTYDSPNVAPNVTPPHQTRNTLGAEALGAQASQNQQLGRGLSTLDEQMNAMIKAQQDKLDTVVLTDAQNQFKRTQLEYTTNDTKTGYRDQVGRSALPQDGRSLSDIYGERLKKTNADIVKGLPNERVREAYRQWSDDQTIDFDTDIRTHASNQTATYTTGVADAAIGIATDDLTRNADKPETIARNITAIEAAARMKGEARGWDDTQIILEARKHTNAALETVVTAALDKGDWRGAQTLMEQYSVHMEGGALAKIHPKIKEVHETQVAEHVTGSLTVDLTDTFNPTNIDASWAAMIKQESSGNQFGTDGKPLTSPAGAVGAAQVMETTGPEAAKMAGVAWDRRRWANDRAYNLRIGRGYFDNKVREFHGDTAKAAAAYNAGSSVVKTAVAKYGDDWLEHLPAKETRDYVKVMLERTKNGTTTYPVTEDEFVAQAINALPPASSASLVKKTESLARKRYADTKQSASEQQNQSVNAGIDWVMANPGVAWENAPAGVRVGVPTAKQMEMSNFADRAAGGIKTDPEVYTNLKYNTGQQHLSDLSDAAWAAYRKVLSPKDWQELEGIRARARNPSAYVGETRLVDHNRVHAISNAYIRTYGLQPNKKNKTDMERYNAWNIYLEQEVREKQSAIGRTLTEDETRGVIRQSFDNRVHLTHLFFGMQQDDGDKRMFETGYENIDKTEISSITAAFTKSGVKNPTREDIIAAYYRRHRTN